VISMDTPAALPVHGRVAIEWPNAERCAPGPLQCWRTTVRDAGTGQPLPGLASVSVTAGNGKHVFADVTHWVDGDGEILPAGEGLYYSRSYQKDTARSEERTIVATSRPEDAGVYTGPRRMLASVFGADLLAGLLARARADLSDRVRLLLDEELVRFVEVIDTAGDCDDVAAIRLYQAEFSLEAVR